jgi:predicted transcriptional regulator
MRAETVHIRITPEQLARLDEMAESELRSRSNMAAAILAQALEEPTEKEVIPNVW